MKNQKECKDFVEYKKCINTLVKKSKCSSEAKEMAIIYLESRVKFAIDCKTGNKIVDFREGERILVESEMQSEIDGIYDRLEQYL